jgi:hypothetical protein
MATRKPIKKRPLLRKRSPDVLLPGRNARVQSRERFAAEVAKRRSDQENPANTLLSPDEVAGEYYLDRGLMTTLGGAIRPITYDDLKQFQYNVAQVRRDAAKRKMLGGIRAKQVIDKSWSDDRKRAQAQIHLANPTHYKAMTEGGGQSTSLVVHFITNSGPESEYTHHNVNVQFLDFGAIVASPAPAKKMAKQMTEGRLKFECSCNRFKFWLRYLNTQLETVYGRTEAHFPKIRNPTLGGIACKHALRVMQTIQSSPTFNTYAANVIQKFRDDIGHTAHVERIADQRKFETERRKEDSRKRRIQSTEEKRLRRQSQPAYARQQARERARAVEKEKARITKSASAARVAIERNARELLKLGAINQTQFDQMMEAAKGS